MLIPVVVMLLLTGFGTTGMAQHGKGDGPHMMGESRGYMMRGGCDGTSWKDSLSQAQKDKIEKMKVDYLKVKYPKKARMKTLKVDLAVLVASDAPKQKDIDARIDELVALKKDLLKAKYAHKVAVRKELKPEQQAAFDKHMLKKAKRKKCRYHH
jgi:Spy/CpxP family protein refolding chaperone